LWTPQPNGDDQTSDNKKYNTNETRASERPAREYLFSQKVANNSQDETYRCSNGLD